MDPHSRLSQFNQRNPRSGPSSPRPRFMEQPSHRPGLENLTKRSNPTTDPSNSPHLTQRPIATNSRVKQNEKYRKDMYLAFVNNALLQQTNGNPEPFDELVNQFNPKKFVAEGVPYTADLRLWILALSHVVSRLERRHAALVEAIVNMPWTTMDDATVKSYTTFIGMLLSARPEYLSLVLTRIASGFTHQSGIQALDYGTPESSRSPLTRRIIYNRLHNLLQHLLSLIPTLSSTLHPLLVRNFPHKRQELVAQTTYIRNILRVSEYCHQLGDKILAIIVDRAIQIDVEIQVELEDEEEEQADTEVFEVDPFDTLLGQEGEINDSDSDSDSDDGNLSDISSEADDNNDIIYTMEGPINIPHIHEMVKKLDAILTLMFDHFNRTHLSTNAADPTCAESARSTPIPGSDPSEQESQPPLDSERACILRKSQFHTLLAIFDRTIIRTFKSRYTQFLVFWFASLDPEFSDLFQGMLVSKALLDNDQPEVTRAASASYIGSFVSRASFVEREGARRVMRVLCEFLGNHLDIYEAYVQSGTVPSTAHHGVFYAVSQAVFLIFCFRWRDFLEEEQEADAEVVPAGKKWMPSLSVIQRVIISTLNPLKICSNNVVMQFARVSQAADFIYCYSIMESNKRSEFQTNSDNNKSNPTPAFFLGNSSLHAELNTFFPFDPYKLPKSNKYIEGIYRDWSSVAIDEEDSDNDSNDEEDNEHEGYLNKPQDTEISFASYLDIPHAGDNMDDAGLILGESLGAMSISPVRPETLIPLRFDH